ncbi:glutathione S-transferase family protein [Maricurvus nonylphenolicus]|uniref:glutathione S-transferase family protein n=1 Tax=Maricurvus nonylphenolicus TaxID=1008307 RepID=UPI0036F26F61
MNTPSDPHSPYTVYKSDLSYFSGKLEAYLRYKQIPHQPQDMDIKSANNIVENTGFKKVPAVKTADNKWLFDTTPMLQWFDQRYPQGSIYPEDQALRFIALLLEDYGDEWLWRPAMWWRWMPRASRWAVGWRIGAETIHPLLGRPLGWYFGKRQLKEWLWDDGVTKENVADVRDMLFREFEFLEPLFEQQPFILGSHPSAADFGYFASMFRHFGNDPESAEVVRRHGPNTYEWLARLWNAKASKLGEQQTWAWPEADYWKPILERIAQDYLPYLHENALAFTNNQKRFNHAGKTFRFNNTKTTDYRVYCREILQQEFADLSEGDKARINTLFEPVGGLDALHADGILTSGMKDNFKLPRDPSKHKKHKQTLAQLMFGQPRN